MEYRAMNKSMGDARKRYKITRLRKTYNANRTMFKSYLFFEFQTFLSTNRGRWLSGESGPESEYLLVEPGRDLDLRRPERWCC